MVGFSTSIPPTPPGSYSGSTLPALTSIFHQASVPCDSPRNVAPWLLASGNILGTAQYTVRLSPGAHTHLSIVVRIGREMVLAFSSTRAVSVELPDALPYKSAEEFARGNSVRALALGVRGDNVPFLNSYTRPGALSSPFCVNTMRSSESHSMCHPATPTLPTRRALSPFHSARTIEKPGNCSMRYKTSSPDGLRTSSRISCGSAERVRAVASPEADVLIAWAAFVSIKLVSSSRPRRIKTPFTPTDASYTRGTRVFVNRANEPFSGFASNIYPVPRSTNRRSYSALGLDDAFIIPAFCGTKPAPATGVLVICHQRGGLVGVSVPPPASEAMLSTIFPYVLPIRPVNEGGVIPAPRPSSSARSASPWFRKKKYHERSPASDNMITPMSV